MEFSFYFILCFYIFQTTIRTLIFNHTVKEAIDAPMFHHQLIPMVWSYQYGTLKVHMEISCFQCNIYIL